MPLMVSVIVCAYTEERWEQLINAIESVWQQSVQPKELIVVIDYNSGLYKRLQKFGGNFTLLENNQNKGLSGARNTGIAIAAGELIAFLDDDAVAAPSWLEMLVCQFGDHVLGVGSSVKPVWESNKPFWFPEEFYWTVGCSYLGMPDTLKPIRNPMGGAMCVRKEIFIKVGDFCNGLGRLGIIPLGCEETEWCIRARQYWSGTHFLYEPRTAIYHHIPSRRANFKYFCSRCYSEGVSKALVVGLVGGSDGLSSERAYTFKTLPQGFLRGLGDTLRGDLSGFCRSASIFIGLSLTTFGYIVGTVKRVMTKSSKLRVQSVKINGL